MSTKPTPAPTLEKMVSLDSNSLIKSSERRTLPFNNLDEGSQIQSLGVGTAEAKTESYIPTKGKGDSFCSDFSSLDRAKDETVRSTESWSHMSQTTFVSEANAQCNIASFDRAGLDNDLADEKVSSISNSMGHEDRGRGFPVHGGSESNHDEGTSTHRFTSAQESGRNFVANDYGALDLVEHASDSSSMPACDRTAVGFSEADSCLRLQERTIGADSQHAAGGAMID